MKSAKLGKPISPAEVTNVSRHGFWLLVQGVEKFVAFDVFPWFLDVPVSCLLDVHLQGPDHLYWPQLDIDLSVESIDHPEKFPLVSRQRPNMRLHLPKPRQR